MYWSHFCRYVPIIYPGAGLDETARNCIFVCYFLTVLYMSTNTVWILALRPVLLDISPPAVSVQSARTASMYIKVKEDVSGNWSLNGTDTSASPENKIKASSNSNENPKFCDLSRKVAEGKDKSSRDRDRASSLLSSCCGGRREVQTSSEAQERSCRNIHSYEASRRRDEWSKDAKTPRSEDTVLASSVLVRRGAAAQQVRGPTPADDYISRDLARSSAAIGWGGANASPRIAVAE